jgi:hypothetical protein
MVTRGVVGSDFKLGSVVVVETNKRLTSMRQIHAAIDHLHKAEFESAITLGSAAEGILPGTRQAVSISTTAQSLPADTPGATGVNALTNWTKHGTHETATISEQDAIEIVTRAASKFVAVYDEQSAKMKEFSEWAIERLQADKEAN